MRIPKRPARLLAAIAVFLLPAPAPADDPPKGKAGDPPSGSKPIPRASGSSYPDLYSNSLELGRSFDLLIRGTRSRLGRFDPDGNFIPEPLHESFPPMGPMSGPFQGRFTNHVRGPHVMAEHRSGRLLLGTMVKGVFVPEIGSKVLDLKKDFDIKKPDRMVYNLWETVGAFWTEERKKLFPKGLPRDPEPPEAGTPAGWKLVPFSAVTGNKRDPWQIRIIGEIAEFGSLDDRGEFIPDYTLPIVSRKGILSGAVRKDPTDLSSYPWRFYTVPFDGAWGRKEVDKEDVYEFRSGRLIKGTLQKTGNFVPELGSKLMDFKDYDPIADRRRIYNLPGVLKKIEKK